MGTRGPVPKRSSQRRRRNKPKDGDKVTKASVGVIDVSHPPAKRGWHPTAKAWYDSLAESGQAQFYQPSDWATAVLVAESMSRDLRPKVVAVTRDGKVIKESVPLSGASLQAYLKAMGELLTTEGARRRARLELETPAPEGGGTVSWIDHARRRGASPS